MASSLSPSSSVSPSPSQQIFGKADNISVIQDSDSLIIEKVIADEVKAENQADSISVNKPAATEIDVVTQKTDLTLTA